MSLAFSSYNVGAHNNIEVACLGECSTASNTTISNLVWKYDTSINPKSQDKGQIIVTDVPSDLISDCDGQTNDEGHPCTECYTAYYENEEGVYFG